MSKLDGQAQNAAINLEGLSDSELVETSEQPWVHSDVRHMCLLLLESRKERLAGEINKATRYERVFDELYNTLPKHLRW